MFPMSIFKNPIFYPVLITTFTAQVLKFVIEAIKNKNIDLKYLISSGGMPSSHSAMVSSLLTTLALNDPQGVNSKVFAISLTFALIVMYDAANIRRSAGEHAALLNKLSKLIHYHSNNEIKLNENDLKEVLGHTPLEVISGALLGIILSVLINRVAK